MNFHTRAEGRAIRIVQGFFWVLLVVVGTARITAQPAAGTPTPAIQTPPSPSLSLGTPALSLNPVAANGSNALASSTNTSIAGLSALLSQLQQDLTQLLPVLTAFNNSFEFVTARGSVNTMQVPGTTANFGSNLSANFSSNLGNNFAAGVGTPIPITGSNPLGTNSFGLPAGFGVAPVTSETLRALLVLESDLQRLQPTLNSLSGNNTNFVGIGLTPGFVPGPITRVFGVSQTGR